MEAGIFVEAYKGVPPWDINRPQPEIMQLVEAGAVGPTVLDVGCGTGENALYLAGLGYETWGIDVVPEAIRRAETKAKERGLNPTLLVGDALKLEKLRRKFDTVIDLGLFHTFTDEERPMFARSLASILKPGGNYFMMCFSEHEPGTWGPRRVTQAEIRLSFEPGWRVESIRAAKFDTNLGIECCNAWFASLTLVDAKAAHDSDAPGLLLS